MKRIDERVLLHWSSSVVGCAEPSPPLAHPRLERLLLLLLLWRRLLLLLLREAEAAGG
jgi:hypothetical protein